MPNLKAVAKINKASNCTQELLVQISDDPITTDTLQEIASHLESARNILINEVVKSYLVLFHTGSQITQFRHVDTREQADELANTWGQKGLEFRSTILHIQSRGSAQIGW